MVHWNNEAILDYYENIEKYPVLSQVKPDQIKDSLPKSAPQKSESMDEMMRDLDENYIVLLGGQDGWLASENFVDQVPLWLKGEYIQIPLRIENVRKAFLHRMMLQPATADGRREM